MVAVRGGNPLTSSVSEDCVPRLLYYVVALKLLAYCWPEELVGVLAFGRFRASRLEARARSRSSGRRRQKL